MEKNVGLTLFETSVKETVTFTYIMTFDCTNVLNLLQIQLNPFTLGRGLNASEFNREVEPLKLQLRGYNWEN